MATKSYGTFKYWDADTFKTAKCDQEHLPIFEGKRVFMDYSNPASFPRLRLANGQSVKALVLEANGEEVWSDGAKPRQFSRHIAHKNRNPADVRSANLILGRDTE